MPNIKPEIEAFARIKVIGAGGSGKNAVNHMIGSKVRGVDFIVVNTDAQDLHNSLAKKKIHIGKNITRGLGTGMNPDLGRRAAEENRDEIQEIVKGSDMIFVTGGLGGGTFTGASSVIARTAKELGCLTVAVATKPFFFEGRQRSRIADAGLEDLRKEVDAIIIIPNDRLLAAVDKETTVKNAFAMCDDILRHAVEGIADLITTPGLINIDFADIRTVMENAGSALMGIGRATGENRAIEAAKAAINSPLLDVSINGAKGVLFSVAGGEDLTMFEIQDAAKAITESVDPEAKIIFGTVRDDKLKKDEVKVTVIATGFPEGHPAAIPARAPVAASASTVESAVSAINQAQDKPARGRIFNSLGIGGKDKDREPVAAAVKTVDISAKKDKDAAKDEDDDWGAVPAFLRRSRLK
ncbi:MAG: cell division protein FtsZ [Patescibacteria group bacterium]|nr:cell division protein FtsZ [Patescibacteria group bacterium]